MAVIYTSGKRTEDDSRLLRTKTHNSHIFMFLLKLNVKLFMRISILRARGCALRVALRYIITLSHKIIFITFSVAFTSTIRVVSMRCWELNKNWKWNRFPSTRRREWGWKRKTFNLIFLQTLNMQLHSRLHWVWVSYEDILNCFTTSYFVRIFAERSRTQRR